MAAETNRRGSSEGFPAAHGPLGFSPPKFWTHATPGFDRQLFEPWHCDFEMVAPGITGRTQPAKVKKRAAAQKRKRDDVDVEKLEQAVAELVWSRDEQLSPR